jgi:hypothetical protein
MNAKCLKLTQRLVSLKHGGDVAGKISARLASMYSVDQRVQLMTM